MSLFIAYYARAGVGEARNDDIIVFLNGIYTRLGRWHYLKDSDDFPKKRLTILRIVKSCKLVPMGNAPIFAYPLYTICYSSFDHFTLLSRFNNLW